MLKKRWPLWSILLALLLLGFMLGCRTYTHSVKQVHSAAQEQALKNTDSTIVLVPGKRYDRKGLHRWLYGKHYRQLWNTPVEVQVLDLAKEKGGLSPIKKGGSRQTISLRVKDSVGHQYVLRSVDKEPAGEFSSWLKDSYAADVARDATAALHPYAALTVPPMAHALGVYYTRPELRYIPYDSVHLKEFYKDFAGMLVLMERRPDEDQSDAPWFGSAENVVSTATMLEDRFSDNDNAIDARFFLRSRLLDMLIGDWSRHEGNWRWSEFEKAGKGKLYRAVSRDRDNVYYLLNDAPIPWLFMQTGFKSHFRTFTKDLERPELLNKSGRRLDELILTSLSLAEWQEIIHAVREQLTDSVLEEALRQVPEPVYAQSRDSILPKLKARRKELKEAATRYFKELVKEVEVVGSDKHEEFVVSYEDAGQLRVQVYKIFKEGKRDKLIYDQVFKADDTKEITLLGLAGNDIFSLQGNGGVPIQLHLYGGAGEDAYFDERDKKAKEAKVSVQDTEYGNRYKLHDNVKLTIENNPPAQQLDANGLLLKYYLD